MTIMEKTIEKMETNAQKLPEYMRGGVIRYVIDGIPPGGFLEAVFCNDLVEAASRADSENQTMLFQYAQFLYHAPGGCWGNEKVVEEWCEVGGLRGMYAEAGKA